MITPWIVGNIIFGLVERFIDRNGDLTKIDLFVEKVKNSHYEKPAAKIKTTKSKDGFLVLTFSHYVLAYTGKFDEGAQLMQVLNKGSRAYFKQRGTTMKRYLSLKQNQHLYVSAQT